MRTATRTIDRFRGGALAPRRIPLCFWPVDSARREEVPPLPLPSPVAPRLSNSPTMCMDAASAGLVDAICFTPLNKQSMIMAGMTVPGRSSLLCRSPKGEFLLRRAEYTRQSVDLSHFLSRAFQRYRPLSHRGTDRRTRSIYSTTPCARPGSSIPAVAVAALNPHGGEGGNCGREEIDIIAPALAR